MAYAIQYDAVGRPDVLRYTEITAPEPGPGEVAVRVTAAGVNPRDLKLRSGERALPDRDGPHPIGIDGAGHITLVGADVDGFRPGDPVLFTGADGAYATDAIASAQNVFRRLPGVTATQGAALGIPAGTAYQTLRSLGVRGDDTLLLHGGSGAVGQAAIQFAAATGARVLATASPRRAELVAALGGEPISYHDDIVAAVRALAPDGVTVIVDLVGTDEAFEASFALLANRKRIATIVHGARAADLGIRAFSGGAPEPLTARQVAWRSEGIAAAVELLARGQFHVDLGPQLPLEDAAQAHRLVEAGGNGKITLIPPAA